MNMSNFHLLQNTSQQTALLAKAMKEAAQAVQLNKQPKKALQLIAQDLNISKNIKKEEIRAKIPDQVLQKYLMECQTKSIEGMINQVEVFRKFEILQQLLREFQKIINKQIPQAFPYNQQPSQMYQQRINPFYPMYIPQQQLVPFTQNLSASHLLYQQQIRQQQSNNQFYVPQYQNWINQESSQQQEHQLIMCPCKVIASKRQSKEHSQEVKCINCDQQVHSQCIKLNQNEFNTFECASCILNKIDCLNRIQKVLCKPQLMSQQHTQLNFVLTIDDFAQLREKQYQIEIRSIRLDAKYMNEITWPDVCEIFLNQNKICDQKPLKSNSSLKKRKDDVQIITIQSAGCILNQGLNSILIKDSSQNQLLDQRTQFKLTEDAVYAYAIYLTQKRLPCELISQIFQKNTLKQEECIEQIKQACIADQGDQDLQIDKITVKVSFKCQFDSLMIHTPARGKFCKHVQCFSLQNTIAMTANCQPRKWKCPVCKKKIFDMVIDSYQLSLLENYRKNNQNNIKEVVFDSEGQVLQEIFENVDSSDDEDNPNKKHQITTIQDDDDKQKIKPIIDPNLLRIAQQSQLSNLMDPRTQQYLQMFSQQNLVMMMQQQKQQQLLQSQLQQQQQKNQQSENISNKQQLKQLIESNSEEIDKKQQNLSNNLQKYSMIQSNEAKALSFSQWEKKIELEQQPEQVENVDTSEKEIIFDKKLQQEESKNIEEVEELNDENKQYDSAKIQEQIKSSENIKIIDNTDKITYKSSKAKGKIVKIIRRQLQDFLKKNLGNGPQQQYQQQYQQQQQQQQIVSAQKKLQQDTQHQLLQQNRMQLQFSKLLADSVISLNPGTQGGDKQKIALPVPNIDLSQIQNQQQSELSKGQSQQEQDSGQKKIVPEEIMKTASPIPQNLKEQKQPQKQTSGLDMDNPICID